jgi:hypothetical protein
VVVLVVVIAVVVVGVVVRSQKILKLNSDCLRARQLDFDSREGQSSVFHHQV